jgi:hypothetical protein
LILCTTNSRSNFNPSLHEKEGNQNSYKTQVNKHIKKKPYRLVRKVRVHSSSGITPTTFKA